MRLVRDGDESDQVSYVLGRHPLPLEDSMKKLLLAAAVAGSLAFTPATLEPHPHIKRAITELAAARKELASAAHDFGGHRADALAAIDGAIKQLKLAQQFDK